MRTRRAHVFTLTDDQQAFIDLWLSRAPGMSTGEFCRQLGVNESWGMATIRKHFEICAMDPGYSSGHTPLKAARGHNNRKLRDLW